MYKIIFLLLISIILILNLKYNTSENFDNNVSFLNKYKTDKWSQLGFNDKLKIYSKNLPVEYSNYVDKYKVKKIVKNMKIDNLFVSKTFKVLDINNKKINLNSLPKDCVVKTNNGSGDVILIKNRNIYKMIGRGKVLEPKVSNYKKWLELSIKPHITKYENQYKYVKPVVFVEEFLGTNIQDYKFFCINGKVTFFHIDSNRFSNHCQNIYDINFNCLPFTIKKPNCKFKVKKPKNFKKMIAISEILSKKFDFVRVDLYEINNKIYFGEYTFAPGGTNKIFKPIKYEYEIGKKWV